MTTPDRNSAVVHVHEYGVAPELIQEALLQLAILRSVEEQRATAIRGPVAAQERLFVVHERPPGMPERKAAKIDPLHRTLFAAPEFDQVRQTNGLKSGGAKVGVRRRP